MFVYAIFFLFRLLTFIRFSSDTLLIRCSYIFYGVAFKSQMLIERKRVSQVTWNMNIFGGFSI